MSVSQKFVYFFSEGDADGDADQKDLLGGKGANLAQMCRLGLPVPPGFTITTAQCEAYHENQSAGAEFPAALKEQVEANLKRLEKATGRCFGKGPAPLLLSVRSGAKVSMPGMMDSVLNLGLNDRIVEAMLAAGEDERFVCDTFRRLLQMYGDVVLGIDHNLFEEVLQAERDAHGVSSDTELGTGSLMAVLDAYKEIYSQAGRVFPQDPRNQLYTAIGAVFKSWQNPRAVSYRRIHGVEGLTGTAVNVQTMVFGNRNSRSGTGVAFTRNPSTGENALYGEYLKQAQGEDLVAGIRTPAPITHVAETDPVALETLHRIRDVLERHYRSMQDFEFTIDDRKLYMLQTRDGKRTAQADIQMAVDMSREGLISREEAIMRVSPEAIVQVLHPTFAEESEEKAVCLGKGLPASPGAVSGKVVFDADDAEAWTQRGETVVLVRHLTEAADVAGMHAADGILTLEGGMTSHAAVIARGMNTCCVVGCRAGELDEAQKVLRLGGHAFHEGDVLSLNGFTGAVYAGAIETLAPSPGAAFKALLEMADRWRRLGVRANADTPDDVSRAIELGAEGIGLVRTEHMFSGKRIHIMRDMILAETDNARKKALGQLLNFQREDFMGILRAAGGRPVTIRLLDPPLHEFLPKDLDSPRVRALHEFNPMLGHRGCRLGITDPDITAMQSRAIFEAGFAVEGARIEIMVPLVGDAAELVHQKGIILSVLSEVKAEKGCEALPFTFSIGSMIEVPRAAQTAGALAREAAFFSFGSNDLTQLLLGISRDDAAAFMAHYLEAGIFEKNPFVTIDQEGVGAVMQQAVLLARRGRAGIKMGLCGAHGGDPESIAFCDRIGLDYVSCVPSRVPGARLAAAQAVLTASAALPSAEVND